MNRKKWSTFYFQGAVLRLTVLLAAWCCSLSAAGVLDARGTANEFRKPVALKVLLIGAPGLPGFDAMAAFMDQIGIPYDAAAAAPVLESNGVGKYQGIVIANSGLPTPELDAYAATYGVRTVIYYVWPNAPQYGVAPAAGAPAGTGAGGVVQVLSEGQAIFDYLRPAAALEFKYSYLYPAAPVAQPGETSTAVLAVRVGDQQYAGGIVHKKPDGREYFTLTFDNNPYMIHSMALNYGILRWVTRGVFLGARKVYLSPQVDDVLIATDLFDARSNLCVPGGFIDQPTFDPLGACEILKIDGNDLTSLASWQDGVQKDPQFAAFRVAMAFNGYGADPDSGLSQTDGAKEAASKYSKSFFWLSHTYDHENLDCYQAEPNSPASSCKAADAKQSEFEITQNDKVAARLKLDYDKTSMVTPGLSGLNNPAFLTTAVKKNIRYFVADWSQVQAGLPGPNTGILRAVGKDSVFLIPRYATNIFYNTSVPDTGAPGSETDEYNHFYGPSGISRLPGGLPFFNTTQSYQDLVDRESRNILTYMLGYSAFPLMYHQANLRAYKGKQSLLSDVMDASLQKFAAISNLPVVSLPQSSIGALLEARMSYLGASPAAILYPNDRIDVKASAAATITLTGVCNGKCETYGGDSVTSIAIDAATAKQGKAKAVKLQ